ncbi:UbiA prenyltransferase family-domain-containing protein [Melanogaster broomeanus]|nr:UbiA prenyltransferase family-domain-containing protein [Melanogaster broomeanus]
MTEKPQTFVSKSPPKWQLYMQLCRLDDFPLGTAFVFWPSAWAATLAAYRYATAFDVLVLHVLTLFGLCTLLHCAGCVINNILDVDYDRQRTKSRPLPSGNISMRSAVALLVVLVMGSLLFLILASPDPFRVGLFSIVLFTLYPLMKRWTNWPQAWLGLTMNCSIFVGWASVGEVQNYTTPKVLFIGAWAWTIIYDTIYACLDKRDDVKAGVGSTALYFGPRIRPALSLFSLMFIASLTYAGVVNDQTAIYFVVSVGGAGLHLLWQLATVDFDSHKDCFDKVCSNITLGFVIWLGLVLDYVVKS